MDRPSEQSTIDRGDLMPEGTCPLLRSKSLAMNTDYRRPVAADGYWIMSSTAICWCIRTMSTMGPDEDDVHPDKCREPRACFNGGRVDPG
jgi:hypothetical protein